MEEHPNVNTIIDWNAINMSYKNLKSFPKVSNQKRIIVFNNKIDRIPKTKCNYTELVGYNNQINFIEYLPESIEILKLSNNLLTSFNFILINLRELDLSKNVLTEFSGEFPKLTNLLLSMNELESVNIITPELLSLDISQNKIKTLNINAPKLIDFYYLNNQFEQVFDIFKQVPELYLFSGTFQKLDLVDIKGIINVKTDFSEINFIGDQNVKIDLFPSIDNFWKDSRNNLFSIKINFLSIFNTFKYTLNNINLQNVTFCGNNFGSNPNVYERDHFLRYRDGSQVYSHTSIYSYNFQNNVLTIEMSRRN